MKVNPQGNCLGRRGGGGRYKWQSYSEVHARVVAFGAALVGRGAKSGSLVAIYSTNCPEWVIASRACNARAIVTCPLYDTLGVDACKFILNQTEAPIVIVGQKQYALLHNILHECPSVQVIVRIGAGEERSADPRVITFEEFEAEGLKSPVESSPPRLEDIATVCYTSGTTGDPKGALISHRALTADVAGVRARLGRITLGPTDVHISYLPLAHMFERLIEELCFCVGAGVGFFGGDVTKIFEDITVLKPTIFVSVPRIYTRLSDRIRDSVQKQGIVSRTLFNLALWTKKRNLRHNITQHWLWDRLVFQKLRTLMGGRVRIMVSGAAPLSEEVMTFLRCSFSCIVMEGYGQTECAAAATATMSGDCSVGHVGPPLPCVEIKLVDVPDMMYFSSDTPRPRGEVCFRGPVLFSGYFKEAAESPIDKDGWLHSGDIGQWNANGTLSIIDRRKNIFKLAQGEYVAPERVEGVYSNSNLVAQIFVTGNSLEASLVAVVVPNEEHSLAFARSNGLPADNLKQLCADHTFKEAVMFDMRTHAARAGLKGFECVSDIVLTTNTFSIENGILTPTYKIKRPVASRVFQREITSMYAKRK